MLLTDEMTAQVQKVLESGEFEEYTDIPVGEDEEVLFRIDDPQLKALITVIKQRSEQAIKEVEKLGRAIEENKATLDERNKRVATLNFEAEIFGSLVAYEIQKLNPSDTIRGVRAGWAVAAAKPSKEKPPRSRMMLGGALVIEMMCIDPNCPTCKAQRGEKPVD